MVDLPALPEPQQMLLYLLTKEGVRFLVIGGQAMRSHGANRKTYDLDIWLSPTREDAERLAHGFAKVAPHLTAEQWADQIHKPNLRMPYPSDQGKEADILTSIDGADFEAAYAHRESAKFGDIPAPVICLADLIVTKKLSLASTNVAEAKARDKADIELLEAMQG